MQTKNESKLNLTDEQKERLDFYFWTSELEKDFKQSYQLYKIDSKIKLHKSLTNSKSVI